MTTIRWNRFVWIQSNLHFSVLCRKSKAEEKKKKIHQQTIRAADVLQQIICTIKIRRAQMRHDSIDFRPLIIKLSESVQLSVVTADKAYDSEDNHILLRDVLHALSVIPAKYEHVPIRKTHGRYRKQMKRGYCKLLYNQRNKNETIVSVIKRLFGEHITSRLVKTQNRELSFRCIAYNIHRLTNLTIIIDGFYKAGKHISL